MFDKLSAILDIDALWQLGRVLVEGLSEDVVDCVVLNLGLHLLKGCKRGGGACTIYLCAVVGGSLDRHEAVLVHGYCAGLQTPHCPRDYLITLQILR